MARRNQRRRAPISLVITGAMFASVVTLSISSPAAAAPCDEPVVNEIACENSKPGNPESEWGISGAGERIDPGLRHRHQCRPGRDASASRSTPTASVYRLDIYRMGYYGGDGARLVATVTPDERDRPTRLPERRRRPAWSTAATGPQSASWTVPADARVRHLLRQAGPHRRPVRVEPHLLRRSRRRRRLRPAVPDRPTPPGRPTTTTAATASTAGRRPGAPTRSATTDRSPPGTTRRRTRSSTPSTRWSASSSATATTSATPPVSTPTGSGAELLEHDVFVSVGHDEYWSAAQRTNVEAARDAGVHLAFFSGNEVFWKTRWETSIDGSGTPYRTLVSYKETLDGAIIDPAATRPGPAPGATRASARPADGGRPENALTGQIFTVNCCADRHGGRRRRWRHAVLAEHPRRRPDRRPDHDGRLAASSATSGTRTSTTGSGLPGCSVSRRPRRQRVQILQDYGSHVRRRDRRPTR